MARQQHHQLLEKISMTGLYFLLKKDAVCEMQ